ncbi:hypothetical protein [Caulobacter sp. 17J80-11]|uniref:hypothetical protein n=1 Tax=Caulobacter sp. 17J80-11 TaxID=2763502 RepID=UPI00165363C3|nr:hypothetical protein [Caulobacter sp. 17J80-11]MBC6980326.1 hypothetical protein [Caulobacter sp. 17J80-11]
MSFRIALAGTAVLAVVAAGSTASAAAPAPRSDQALLAAVFARTSRAAAPVNGSAPEMEARPDPAEAGTRRRIEAVEAGERTRSDVSALAPGTAVHAGFRLKF